MRRKTRLNYDHRQFYILLSHTGDMQFVKPRMTLITHLVTENQGLKGGSADLMMMIINSGRKREVEHFVNYEFKLNKLTDKFLLYTIVDH